MARVDEEVRVTVTLGAHFFKFDNEGGGPLKVTVNSPSGQEMGANRLQAATAIMQVAKAYNAGIDIDRYFNPVTIDKESEDAEVIKCQWMRSGKLRIIGRKMKVRLHHALTAAEAATRKRNFTCTMGVYKVTPKERGSE
jgi:hypothetical protein